MKRVILILLLISVVSFGLVAGGQQEGTEQTSEQTAKTTKIEEMSIEDCKGSVDNPYISEERKKFLEGKPYEGVTIDILANKGTISQTYHEWIPKWEELTGGKVNLTEVPMPSYHSQVFTDLVTGMGQYDAFNVPGWFYGDFFEGENYLVPIEEYILDPTTPYWCPATVPPAIEKLLKWNGVWYGIPNDNDGQVLYYRKDILNNEEYQNRFKDEYGYSYSVPPKNYQQVIDIADFFNGWDWDNDDKKDYGYAGHYKVGGQGMFHFMTWAGPYIISEENQYFWFNPETMEPLVNSEGHVKALNDLKKLVDNGPRAMMAWTLGEAWDLFLRGDAVVMFTWGDLGALAQDEDESLVKGKMGASILPGVEETYDPIEGEWTEWDEPNRIGNNIGGSWHGAISKHSDNPKAAYDFFAYMARIDNSFWNQMRGWTGVDVGRSFAFLEKHGGSSTIEDFTEQGWNANDAEELSKAYYDSFFADISFNLLRIPGANEYIRAVDVVVSEVLSGKRDTEEALDRLYERFNEITERHGRESQKEYYRQMLVD